MSFATLQVDETKLKGIVYTEKNVAKLMCKLALYGYLVSKLSVLPGDSMENVRESVARMVFEGRRERFSPEISSKIRDLLIDVKVMDPAVGAGIFLTTMVDEILHILSLVEDGVPLHEAAGYLVSHALYGVDIDEEAVRLCRKALMSKLQTYEFSEFGSFESSLCERVFVGDSLFDLDPKYKGKFDIVICNPPYVRQEILPGEYKERLRKCYPELPPSSDLFTYFFLCASSLLNARGVAVMIAPISWLDVQYGASLQRFLMKHMPCSAVFYSDIEKWFPSASISTCISLHKANIASESLDDSTVFVNLKRPLEFSFEHSANGSGKSSRSLFRKILSGHNTFGIIETDEYRLFRIPQTSLYGRGYSGSKYKGSKWTSYLRAPRSFYELHKVLSGKLVRLEEVVKITRGYTTGCNRFFYVKTLNVNSKTGLAEIETKDLQGNPVTFPIEARYLKPLIKSPKEVKGYETRRNELSFSVLLVKDGDKEKLRDRRVLEYINWGEEQGYHLRGTLRRRLAWWCLPELLPSQVLFRQFYDTRFNLPLNQAGFATDHTFYYSVGFNDARFLAALMNSTIVYFFLELNGRVNQSDGVLTCYGLEFRSLNIPLPDCFEKEIQEELLDAYHGLCQRDAMSVFEEVERKDRWMLDHVVLKGLGVSKGSTRDALLSEMYRDFVELVKNRIDRAKK